MSSAKLFIVVVTSFVLGAMTLPAAAAEPAYAEGIVLVGYHPGAADSARAAARASVGAQRISRLSVLERNAEKLQLARGASVPAAIKALLRNPNVRYAEPDYVVTKSLAADDPYFTGGSLWGMYGDATTPRNVFGSHAAEAWAAGYIGSQQVFIGIIDEGFQFTHPELANNAWANPFETPGNGIDDDGNGYIDDVRGWDFYSNDASVYDGTGDDHGTHVAGTIGAQGGNGIGVAGVNWEVSMISAKFLGDTGGYISAAVSAVDYLTDLKRRHGINIVATSNSWGGGGFSQALLDAINRGGDSGILFIAAAGNSSANTDGAASYPASYQCTTATRTSDCVVAVASITSAGDLSSFSNYGATTVDIGAPGSGVNSSVPVDSYASYSGTSMATPHVSGAVALCASVDQTQTAADLRSAVLGSTAQTVSLAGKTVTGGRLDIGAMLLACQPPSTPVAGGPSALSATSSGTMTVRLDWIDGTTGETWFEVQRSDASCQAFSTVATLGSGATSYTATGLQPSTSYCFRVRAGNRYPSASPWTAPASATTLEGPPPYQCSATTYAWIDISAATALALGDDSQATVALPFAFRFYGNPVTSLVVASNGYVRFDGGAATAYTNTALPNQADPNAILALLWDDLNPGAGGAVRTAVVGTAPARRFVVSWDNVPRYSVAGSTLSFQLVLDELTGDATYNYRDVYAGSTTYDRGMSATVGVESEGGIYGETISLNLASLDDSMAMRCAPVTSPTIAPSAPGAVSAAALTTTSLEVSWSDVVGEARYSLERATGPTGGFAEIATLPADSTRYVDAALLSSTTYRYRLRAINAVGLSVYSATASVATPGVGPVAPTGVAATAAANGSSVTVTWADASTNETGFIVERALGTGAFAAVSGTLAANSVSYVDPTTAPATSYRYQVRVQNDAGSNLSAVVSVTTPPAAPAGLSATSASASRIDLAWNAVTGATGYLVERLSGTSWIAVATLGAVTSYADTGLTADTSYAYRSKATLGATVSLPSAEVSARTLVTAPVTPSGLAAAVGAGVVNVSWQAAASATSYTLQRAIDSAGTFADVVTAQNVLAYADTNVSPGTLYRYQVRANNTGGSSAWSAVVSAEVPPAVPGGLAASNATSSSLTLSWAPATGANGYSLQWSPNGSSGWTVLATQSGTSYTHAALTAATLYYYQVRANSTSAGSSAWSAAVSGTTLAAALAAPSGLAASATSATSAQLNWVDNAATETGYEVWRALSGGSFSRVATLGASVTSYANTGLTEGLTYVFRVRTVQGTTFSAYSPDATVVLPPALPTNFAATLNSTATTATITWRDASKNETGFDLGLSSSVGGVWGPITVVGSLGVNVTRTTHIPGAGTHRYYVRARNAGAVSAWVGPSATLSAR